MILIEISFLRRQCCEPAEKYYFFAIFSIYFPIIFLYYDPMFCI